MLKTNPREKSYSFPRMGFHRELCHNWSEPWPRMWRSRLGLACAAYARGRLHKWHPCAGKRQLACDMCRRIRRWPPCAAMGLGNGANAPKCACDRRDGGDGICCTAAARANANVGPKSPFACARAVPIIQSQQHAPRKLPAGVESF